MGHTLSHVIPAALTPALFPPISVMSLEEECTRILKFLIVEEIV